MPRSKDPRRYAEPYLAAMVEMEQGKKWLKIPCVDKKSAENFRLNLYGYAHAWEWEGLKYQKLDPARSEIARQHAAAMSRYQLTLEPGPHGTFAVMCRHNSEIPVPEIISSEETVDGDAFDPPKTEESLQHIVEQIGHKEDPRQYSPAFHALMNPKGIHEQPLAPGVTEEDLNGPQDGPNSDPEVGPESR